MLVALLGLIPLARKPIEDERRIHTEVDRGSGEPPAKGSEPAAQEKRGTWRHISVFIPRLGIEHADAVEVQVQVLHVLVGNHVFFFLGGGVLLI